MQMRLIYHNLTHHIIPGPQNISYFIPLLLLPAALLIPRSVLSRWQSIPIFIPLIVAALVDAWRAMRCIDVISVNALIWSFYLLILHDPWQDFRLVSLSTASERVNKSSESSTTLNDKRDIKQDQAVSESAKPSSPSPNTTHQTLNEFKYPSTFRLRLSWVGRLLVSIRLNNWKINVTSHDKHQPPTPAFATQKAFAAQALLSCIRGIATLAFTSAYIASDPYFTNLGISISSPLPISTVSHVVPAQIFRSAIIAAQAWALISQVFYIPFLLLVGLNALQLLSDEWSPHTWAPYFGSPEVVFLHGVRGFWGQYWHQTMRHSCSGPGYALANGLRLRHGGITRYMVINVVAFGLSGIVHSGLVPPEPLYATKDTNTIRLYFAAFFWMQPIAMFIETMTIRMLNKTGLTQVRYASRLIKLTNAIWVICWFAICLPLLGEAGRQLGYWRHLVIMRT